VVEVLEAQVEPVMLTKSAASMTLRTAQPADLPAITDIYHHYVKHSTCTFETEPRPPEAWQKWFESHTGPHPAIVAIDDGHLIGWGSLSTWNVRCAYRHSVEDSVYVRHDCHRRGVGRALLESLLARARSLGHRVVIAQIADHQPASERLHEVFGFRRVGCLEQVGFKFDRCIDVVIWQLLLPQTGGGHA